MIRFLLPEYRRFKATNAPPYSFECVDDNETRLNYAAALSRIGARYQQRF